MKAIGNLGMNIVFQTSSSEVLTFRDFNQKVSSSWSNHSLIGLKPRGEFNGSGLRKISFKIFLDAMLGIKPRSVIEKLEEMTEMGEINYLVIGGKQIGAYRWKILDMSEEWDIILSGGELARATLSINLEEYA